MAVTADQLITARVPGTGRLGEGLAVASQVLYAGTLCYFDANGFISNDDAAGANVFAGIVRRQVDNSAGASGDLKVEFYTVGDYVLPLSGAAQADVNSLVYGSDNYTLTLTAAGSSLVGMITRFVGTGLVEVRIDRKA
jgi:hypothetical protein